MSDIQQATGWSVSRIFIALLTLNNKERKVAGTTCHLCLSSRERDAGETDRSELNIDQVKRRRVHWMSLQALLLPPTYLPTIPVPQSMHARGHERLNIVARMP